ncbi:MAG: nickel-responsive transcriptional regulator NikR [Candidatus Thorarchaeota archaeon]|nr:nickel-responsive transcriptional regulator NikR [Candidatus Thorarchaeota archaeon]
MELKRFGVSIPRDLLELFDEVVTKRGYIGRSEAIRDAMRLYISQQRWESEDATGFASINIVYEHKPKLMAALLKSQHDSKAKVISTLHTHITHTHCFEILTVEGTVIEIHKLADKIGGISGIEFIEIFTFSLPETEGCKQLQES